jgi:acyl-CoA thioesterase II
VGDFSLDTAVGGHDGRYTATLSSDWEIWGPNGGYVAAIALRAAGAHSRFDRPATFSCHYLSQGAFDEVQLEVTTLRASRRAESIRVSMLQGDRRILEALVWTVDELPGLEHDHSSMPDVPRYDDLPTFEELTSDTDYDGPHFPFWENFDYRPLGWVDGGEWLTRRPTFPAAEGWFRFVPRSTFDDPYLDAARSVLVLDTMPWPAAVRAHTGDMPFIAPSIDLSVQLHRAAPASEWLFLRAESPIAENGLIGGTAKVWSADGQLLATAVEQMLCVPAPPMP